MERTIEQWSFGGVRVRWGAVMAGWAVGLATQLVLTLLGLAIGAWSIDLQESSQSGQPPQQTAESALQELQQKLMALDRDAAINVMTTKMGMTEPQAKQVVQTTIGFIEPLKEKAQQVKQQSVEVGNRAIDRVGTIAMWLAVLGIVTLGFSIGGGITGTPETPSVEMQAEQYRDRAAA